MSMQHEHTERLSELISVGLRKTKLILQFIFHKLQTMVESRKA